MKNFISCKKAEEFLAWQECAGDPLFVQLDAPDIFTTDGSVSSSKDLAGWEVNVVNWGPVL